MAIGAITPITRWQIMKDGQPAAGAKLYTYLSGTDTPQAVYTTSALNVARTNPVEADADGILPICYLANVAYRFTVTDANGASIFPAQDNVYDFGQLQLSTAGASTGSALVGFVQAGTSAVSRTAQAKMREEFSVTDFGAVGDGTTDDYAAFAAAIAAIAALDSNSHRGLRLLVPFGIYRLSQGLTLTRKTIFQGVGCQVDGGASFLSGTERAGTVLLFDTGINGITIQASATNGAWSTIRDMEIRAAAKSASSVGITIQGRAFVENCHVVGFHSHGINITASTPTGNANGWRVAWTRIEGNGGDGLHVSGTDANAGNAFAVDSSSNTGHGFYDNATYGNTYTGCHAADNGGSNYTNNGDVSNTNRMTLVNCYDENGGTTNALTGSALLIGGSFLSGFTAGSAPTFLGDDKESLGAPSNPAYGASLQAAQSRGRYVDQGASITSAINAYASTGRVTHGMTTIAPTATWYSEGIAGADGGIIRQALSEVAVAYDDRAYATTEDTTQGTSSTAPFYLNAWKANGTGVQALGNTANLWALGNAGTTHFILRADGTSFEDVGTAWTNFDEFEDPDLLTAVAVAVSTPTDPVRVRFLETLVKYREVLERFELVKLVRQEDGSLSLFINRSGMQNLLVGAVRQQAERMQAILARLAAVETRLEAL